MRGPLFALSFLSLALAWLVFFGAGARQADWNAALLFIGATAFFYWMFRSGQNPPRMPLWHVMVLWALPAYALFQLIPLPPEWLETLSPARMLIHQSLLQIVPAAPHAPIAVSPAAAMWGLVGLLACLSIFSLIRDLEWRAAVVQPWLTAVPLVAIAGIEAFIGVGQWLAGAPQIPVRGTLSTVEQFAGLLEPALPFALIFGFVSFRRHQVQGVESALPAARAAVAWVSALAILIALFHSTSQASHVVVFASLFVLMAFALLPRLRTQKLRLIGLAVTVLIAVVTVLILVSPADVSGSLAQLGADEQETADSRVLLWSNSANLWAEYRWLGVGFGGFEAAFLKYQGSTDLNRIQDPHNDVLALLVALGAVGACLFAAALVGVFRPAIMGAIFLQDESRRLLAAAIAAALFGLLIRSGLEASLSMPAVAMSFAWIAGISQSSGLE